MFRRTTGFVEALTGPIMMWLVWLVLSLTRFSPTALAQGADVPVPEASGSQTVGPVLSLILQTHARNALGRHLKPEEFQIFINVTPAKAPPERLPYLPETLSPVPSVEAPVESLSPWLQKVEVEVLISDRYQQDAKTKLEAILVKSLALDPKRGDKIVFVPIGLKFDAPLSDIQRELARSEAESRDLKARLDTLGRERDDAKRDLSQAKAELDRTAREKTAASKDDEEGTDSQATPKNPQGERGFWQENLTVFVAAFLTLIAIFVGNLTIRAAAKTLGSAVQSIGAGIPALGDKLSESLSRQAPALVPAPEMPNKSPSGGERPSADSTLGGASLPIEAVAKRVIELHEELVSAVTPMSEGILLEHLSWLLDDENTIGHAVASMELLGREMANAIYKKLPREFQQKVVVFLRSGVHSKPKGEIMLEVGEALKSRLFGADLPSSASFDQGVRNKLVQLGSDDLIQVARSLEGEHLARLFGYIGPAKLGSVMTVMYKADPTKFATAAAQIAKIPQVEANTNLDQQLVATIEAQISRANSDIQGHYLPYYRLLLESVEDEVAEVIAEQISTTDARVERYLRDTIVIFSTFFRLHEDIQEEIVVALNNRELAALLAILKEESKAKIYNHLESRRKELVDEEVQRLLSKGQRQVNTAHRMAKDQVVARMIQIKGNGRLSDLMVLDDGKTSPSTTATNSEKLKDAA